MLRFLSLSLGELERQALCGEILRLSADTPSYASHNRGGWRTPPTWINTTWLRGRLLALLASVPELRVDPAADQKAFRGWAIVNRKGSYHDAHVHGADYPWSGVVYLDPGGSPSAATIFEWYPTPKAPLESIRVEPKIGRVVVFPSTLGHRVETHEGDGARITVAFDVKQARRIKRDIVDA